MQVDLSGLRALVTGSTKGIGFAIAQKLAMSGAAVAVNGRKAGDVEAALGRIRAAVTSATLIAAPGDVATASGVAAIIKAVGDVDILVNNVGIFELKDAFEIPDDDWQRRFGRIIFVSSESGVQIPTEMIHYGFTKSADLALMRGFAQAAGGNRRHRQRGVAWTDPHRGGRRDVPLHGPIGGRSKSATQVHRQVATKFNHQAAGATGRDRRSGRFFGVARSRRHFRLSGPR